MAFHIRDPETDALARKLAAARGVGLTEVIRDVLVDALDREEGAKALIERVKPLLDEMATYPSTGLEADKAFYDSLYED
mgnify:CR=1 FL=1